MLRTRLGVLGRGASRGKGGAVLRMGGPLWVTVLRRCRRPRGTAPHDSFLFLLLLLLGGFLLDRKKIHVQTRFRLRLYSFLCGTLAGGLLREQSRRAGSTLILENLFVIFWETATPILENLFVMC